MFVNAVMNTTKSSSIRMPKMYRANFWQRKIIFFLDKMILIWYLLSEEGGAKMNKLLIAGSDTPYKTAYEGKTIGFCCASCVDSFNKNPEKYEANLKDVLKEKTS